MARWDHASRLAALLCLAGLAALVEARAEALTDGDWRKILEGEWMIEFYAPWCPACQQLQPEWDKLSAWSKDLSIRVAKVDITLQTGLSGRFLITSLPTIYHVRHGVFRQYDGPRLEKDFLSFVEDRKWVDVKPVSSWVDPGSLAMTVMSSLMDFSHWVKNTHAYLTEQLGVPVWVSYLLFALATITTGLLLGAVFVLVIDRVCPPKRHPLSKLVDGRHSHAPAPPRGGAGQQRGRPLLPGGEETERAGRISDPANEPQIRQRQIQPSEEE